MSHCDEKFLNFCQTMIDVAQFRTVIFAVGSMVEVEDNTVSMHRFACADSIDSDLMMYGRDFFAFSSTDDVPSVYRGKIIRYLTDGIHPGYVRLLRESNGSEVNVKYDEATLSAYIGEPIRCGPAITNNTRLSISKQGNLTDKQASFLCSKTDHVFAAHCPYWPQEAVEWITRQRPGGSLSHEVIRRVVRYGCDFVCVSHKGYLEPDTYHEWRFSFSVAEFLLIKNWSRQQRAMYRTIRVLHKRSLNYGRNSRLCIYHYKTLMLWAVETEPPCFWDDIRLFASVRAVLMDMIHCLKIKCLYHYFIPTNNLFDHLLSEDFSDDINALQFICEEILLINVVLISCTDEEIFNSCKRRFVTMPQMLYNSLNLFSPDNCFDAPFIVSKRNKAELQNSLTDELKTAYGLLTVSLLEQKNLILHPASEGYNWCLNGLQYHVDEECVKNEGANKIFNINRRFLKLFKNFYPGNAHTDYNSWLQHCEELAVVEEGIAKMSTSTTQMKEVLYCRSERRIFSIDSLMPFNSIGNAEHKARDKLGETDEKCLKDLNLTSCEVCPFSTTTLKTFAYRHEFNCGLSPTVPISWFINNAYSANNYYTLFSDYKTAMEICDKTIIAYNTLYGNHRFAEYGFPLILSTQWIETHDIELQQTLGLVALCRFVIHGSDNRSVHLPSCPVQFALYLKLRCMIDSEGAMCVKTMTVYGEHNKHCSICRKRNHLFIYGREALFAAIFMHMSATLIMDMRTTLRS